MKNIYLLSFIILSHTILAQVGFNTNTPHPSSIIEMNADDKGLLIPRMSSLNRRQNIANPANSLLVYDLTEKAFYFRETTANKWTILNPWDQTDTEAVDDIYTHSDVRNVGIGTSSPGSKLSVAGNLAVGAGVANTATTPVNGALIQGNVHLQSNLGIGAAPTANRLHVQGNAMITGTISADEFALNLNGHGPVPAGGIIMWSGAPNAIPQGYVLCNGGTYVDKDGVNRTTPNLSGKFVVGYDANITDYDAIGKMGGNNSITLDSNQIPKHVHEMNHSHTITDPGHSHGIRGYHGVGSATGNTKEAVSSKDGVVDYNSPGKMGVLYNSSTGITVNSYTGNSKHNTTEQKSIDNRPPYYVIAYIMKKY